MKGKFLELVTCAFFRYLIFEFGLFAPPSQLKYISIVAVANKFLKLRNYIRHLLFCAESQ